MRDEELPEWDFAGQEMEIAEGEWLRKEGKEPEVAGEDRAGIPS